MDKGQLKSSSRNRCHHLVKTFWEWRDRQLPDGTVILTSPSGQTYVTTPGSALLFPALCVPTGDLAVPPAVNEKCHGDRTAMMPRRQQTRAQNRAQRIATERQHNHQARQARRRARDQALFGPAPPGAADDAPPPF